MKKLISTILIFVLTFSLVACGEKPVNEAKTDVDVDTNIENQVQEQESKQEIKQEEKDNVKVDSNVEAKIENQVQDDIQTPAKDEAVQVNQESKPVTLSVQSKITSHYVSSDVVNKSAEYVYNKVKEPSVGSVGGEWAVIGLKKSGYSVPADYFEKYYSVCSDNVKSCEGVLHSKKYTEYSRTVLALSLIGKDPTNVEGYNLVEPLNDFEKTVWQGNNGAIWALIAIDANNSECTQRNAYVNAVVKAQLESGAWSITGNSADVDMTGMALQALSGYADKNKDVIEKGFAYIEQQFSAGNITSSESYAQCIVAYAANNRQLPEGMYEAFIQYRKTDGSFEHLLGQGSNQMASEQGLYALVALYRAENCMSKLYKF